MTRRATGWRERTLEALRLAFLVWTAVELARGHAGDALALLVTFAVLHVPRALKLPLVFDVAFLVVWTLQELGQVAGFWGTYVARNIKGVIEVDNEAVQVESTNGTIKLSGSVRSWAEHDAAVDAAWAARGVSTVKDDLLVAY